MPTKRRLTIDEARRLFTFDPDTGHVCWSGTILPGMWPTLAKWAGRRAGAVGCAGYRYLEITIAGERVRDFEHHVIWRMHYGQEPPECMDHMNRDRADNRIANLRAATRADNARNRCRIVRDPNTPCRHKGIYFDKGVQGRKRFRAVIYVKKRRINLGRFLTEEDALAAYQRAARELHGDFASWAEAA